MFERQFVAYGVRIELRADHLAPLDTFIHDELPFGWRAVECDEPPATHSVQYDLNSTDAARAVAARAELFVAEHAPDHLFIHAGVVGWQGRAIVMPGASFAGKTTLVRAWLDAGATYYSDEFAVLDRDGRVHPFARPLAIRDGETGMTRRVPSESLGAASGTTPLPIGLVLATSYRAGARWRPRRLTPGQSLLALMRHTVAARGNPAHSMPILKQAVSGSVAFAGARGEAGRLVAAVRMHVGAAGTLAPAQ